MLETDSNLQIYQQINGNRKLNVFFSERCLAAA
jgi:hypothetical protein